MTEANEQDMATIIKKAQECVEYILMCVLSERKSVFKRLDLNKSVLKDHVRLSKQIVKQTQEFLDQVFGLELIDMDGDDRAEKYGIRSKFDFDSDLFTCETCVTNANSESTQLIVSEENIVGESVERNFEDQLKYSMLMIALSLIFMNGNELDANLFWESLKRLDINKDEKKNKYLGDVGKYFTTELVKEGWEFKKKFIIFCGFKNIYIALYKK